MEKTEKIFFAEVDQKRKSVTPAWIALITILILLFIAMVSGLIVIRNNLKNLSFVNWQQIDRLPQISLDQKINSAKLSGNFSINSIELTEYLNLSDDSFPLKSTYAKIKPDLIVIYGRLKSSRLGLPVSLTMKPEVSDGQFKLTPQPTEMENIYLPQTTQTEIASALSNRISFDLQLANKTKLDRVEAKDDQLIFYLLNQ